MQQNGIKNKITGITKEEFENWLDSFLNFEKLQKKNIFWLDTIQFLCRKFGNPQDCAPCIHVAGSKGKGSVSKMIACIMEKAGYKCGLYSSPHIIDFRERIATAEGLFPDEIYEAAAVELVNGINSISKEELPGGRPLTWFELVTLYAFLCFRQAKVDFAVYEVGLGGRLDATNVVTPKLCCIMPIELEHTEFLGDTIEKIAAEKAGIIKDNIPVIAARQNDKKAEEILLRCAQKHNTLCTFVDNLITSLNYKYTAGGKMSVSFKSPNFKRTMNIKMKLLGSVQAQNAAMAALAVKTAYADINESIIENGIAAASLPGRFELTDIPESFGGIKALVLDGAHTVNSIRFTMDTFISLYPDGNRCLLFSCAADKDVKNIAPLFSKVFSKIVITRPGSIRKSDLNAEEKAFTDAGLPYESEKDCLKAAALLFEKAAAEKAAVLVTGSFYLIADIKKYLSEIK